MVDQALVNARVNKFYRLVRDNRGQKFKLPEEFDEFSQEQLKDAVTALEIRGLVYDYRGFWEMK